MKVVSFLKYLLILQIIANSAYADGEPSRQNAIQLSEPGEVHPIMPYRKDFSATVMSNDRILIVGGVDLKGMATAAVEIYDVKMRRFFSAPPMTFARHSHFAQLLKDNRVLVAGGGVTGPANNKQLIDYSPEVYNPVSSTWISISDIKIKVGDAVYIAELKNGDVLFVTSNEEFMRQSKQASARQFHAWLWDAKRNTVIKKNINATPRAAASIAALHDGRVLITGGRTLAYVPEERCEEIPAKQARAQGVLDGDWCASHGMWDDGGIASSELWDSQNEKITVLPPQPLRTVGELYTQPLRNGDVLIIDYFSSQNIMDKKNLATAIWSGKNGSWRKTSRTPSTQSLYLIQPFLEQRDGDLLGNNHHYSVADNVWTITPPVSPDVVQLQLADEQIIALSLMEPYLRVPDPKQQQWQAVDNNAYMRTYENATLALRDGRLLIVGKMSVGVMPRTMVQLWDPKTDRWSLQKLTDTELQNTQLIQLASGDVLRVGVGAGGMLSCYRWPLSENINDSAWTDCSHLQLKAISPDANSVRYANQPPLYAYALGVLADGRAMLVQSAEQAQLFNEKNNSWSPVKLIEHKQTFVEGAPIRFSRPLYEFHDVASDKLIDVSSLVMRYHQLVAKDAYPDMLWDARHDQWAYVFMHTQMGSNAVMLPDGCAIALRGYGFRLFDPATGKVRELAQPTFRANQSSLAMLPDGTITVAGSPNGSDDRITGFFAERASCKGFESAPIDTVDAAEKNKLTPAKTFVKPASENSSSWLSDFWQWLLRYRWAVLVITGSVLTYLVLKKIIRRAAKYDQPLNAPNVGFVVRLVIYGGLGVVFGPMLWSLVFNQSTNNDDESDAAKQPWYQTVPQRDALPKDLSIPCRFVGFWDARNINPESTLEFRYSMFDDGRLEIYLVRDGMTGDAMFKGNWAFQGKDMIWLKDGANTAPQIDHIVNAEQSSFTVQQADGQYRKFYLTAGVGHRNCVRDGSR
jgi:hypothetical protein